MSIKFASYRFTTQMKFAVAPYIRNATGNHVFEVFEQVQQACDNKHGLKQDQWFMRNVNTGELMSPWHDVSLESTSGEKDELTGVIEITRNTKKKLETNKQLPYNPIMQDTTIDKETGERVLRSYVKPPKFNYGFVPRTWCSDKEGGDSDAIDLVDLSQKQLKPILGVSDYKVLGLVGLVDQGELDCKVLAIEVTEANERGIRNLADYNRQNPGAV